MTMALLALVLLQTPSSQISGQDVLDQAKALLNTVGATGPYRVQKLGPISMDDHLRGYNVVVTDAHKISYEAWSDAKGRILTLRRTVITPFKVVPGASPSPKSLNRLAALTKVLRGSLSTGSPTAMMSSDGTVSSSAPYLIQGFRFVGDFQRYELRIAIDGSQKFLSMDRTLNLPPVGDSRARITAQAADQVALRQLDDRRKEFAATDATLGKVTKGKPQIGWMTVRNEPKARLVWVISYSAPIQSTFSMRIFSMQVIVDAITGTVLPRPDYR